MKKVLLATAAISSLIIGGSLYYYYGEDEIQPAPPVQQTPENTKKVNENVDNEPEGFCLIRYKESTDSKTWKEVVLEDGQKPIDTQECWEKYGALLDKFNKTPDANGHLSGVGEDGVKLSSPAMSFSARPISLKDEHKKDEELEAKKNDSTQATQSNNSDDDDSSNADDL